MPNPSAFVARAREVLADSTIGDLERGRFAVKVLPALLDVAEAEAHLISFADHEPVENCCDNCWAYLAFEKALARLEVPE